MKLMPEDKQAFLDAWVNADDIAAYNIITKYSGAKVALKRKIARHEKGYEWANSLQEQGLKPTDVNHPKCKKIVSLADEVRAELWALYLECS